MDDKDMKDNAFDREETRDLALERLRSSGTVMMTPELFERLYLQPLSSVKGDLRKTFGNPTPLGLLGFVIGLTPLACCLMGWRGSGGLGAANIAVYYFIGGPCLIISGILEFFLGNSFPFAVFTTYGCVFLALAGTLTPFYNAAGAFAEGDFAKGLQTQGFNASLAYFTICVACMNLFFTICATKINLVFILIFVGAGLGFTLLSAALWCLAEAALETGNKLLVGTGAAWFVTAMLGWYLLLVQLLGIMGFELQLPVGDFSRFWVKEAKEDHDV